MTRLRVTVTFTANGITNTLRYSEVNSLVVGTRHAHLAFCDGTSFDINGDDGSDFFVAVNR